MEIEAPQTLTSSNKPDEETAETVVETNARGDEGVLEGVTISDSYVMNGENPSTDSEEDDVWLCYRFFIS